MWLRNFYIKSDTNDARNIRSLNLLALSARCHRINQFLTGGMPAEIKGGRGVVPPKVKKVNRGVVPMQYRLPLIKFLLLPSTSPEPGFQRGIWRQYDLSEKLFGCKQQSK